MSYPIDFVPGSNKYQSLINRCCHGVFRPFGDPQGTSSACELCNSKAARTYSTRLPKTLKRKVERFAPPIELKEAEESTEVIS